MQDAKKYSMKGLNAVGNFGQKATGVSVGVSMIVLGAIIVVLASLGIAQYQLGRYKEHQKAYGIYVTQAVFCAIGAVILVLGIVAVIYNSVKK